MKLFTRLISGRPAYLLKTTASSIRCIHLNQREGFFDNTYCVHTGGYNQIDYDEIQMYALYNEENNSILLHTRDFEPYISFNLKTKTFGPKMWAIDNNIDSYKDAIVIFKGDKISVAKIGDKKPKWNHVIKIGNKTYYSNPITQKIV